MKLIVLFYLCFIFAASIVCSNANTHLPNASIEEIFNIFVRPNYNAEYVSRYNPLPFHKNTLPWRWEGKDLPRVFALLAFERFIVENKISCKKGLAINGLDPEWWYLPYKKVVEVSYEKNTERYDLHTLNLREKDFDFVIVNQTLEHVYDPIRCLKNIYAHMAPGGILYMNLPANNIPHDTPWHYYTGFTPVGLGAVVKLAGFKILSIGQWGNTDYLKMMFDTKSWPDYNQFKGSLKNDMDCPIITWIFAMKQ